MKESLDKMNTVSVTLNVAKEVKLTAVMGMKDADSAEEFNGTLGKLVDTIKTFLPLIAGQQVVEHHVFDQRHAALGQQPDQLLF